ncbi:MULTISPECIES: carbohydrate ABC transporter permease [Streptomyces]|uniref:Carbohydrate ABC transporter permease n=1 Tax=Streptomyces thermoviolaceus subsp. thermoviolaceus TaxID=66860 RepID=A0ABX0Z1K6_STRTL|nr:MULTISPECIES: carbohydrate ABC transporter permease [Streptomyces]MCM3266734.1 carbohydrate ABC transporter permease [Streptomyces thermoviolaceus]NJP17329.1 carbohydrate ABC transporter permease [Streptomyces thermoviolaceus subsp. thermoviolaceus]RSR98318.1 carbohydrate ABC transporter permease [Streptomyces sp. WAC00469]WTD50623.1 carbohydrate ABC transporter permease [Streptomyces thermoviolaceus]GGV76147.1 sugar ABC transporter permease [Streptomyces thermoviolaceus subsp. apingens]
MSLAHPAPLRPRLLGRATVNVVVALSVLYTLLPVLWLVLAAAKSRDAVFTSDLLSFRDFSLLSNVRDLLTTDGGLYGRWYGNSLLYAVLGAALGAMISVACGYAFDKYRFRHKEKLFGLVLAAVMVPQTVLALPLYLIASETGVVNTFWSVFVPVLFNPFGVYLGRIFAQGYVPDEVLEAARVDGAGELTTYLRVSLRMLGPGLVTVFLFQLTAIWNNFFLPMVMLSNQHLYPLSLGLYQWNSQATVSPEYYPVVITGSLLAVLPLILAFVLLQRFWRSGLTAGAVK